MCGTPPRWCGRPADPWLGIAAHAAVSPASLQSGRDPPEASLRGLAVSWECFLERQPGLKSSCVEAMVQCHLVKLLPNGLELKSRLEF